MHGAAQTAKAAPSRMLDPRARWSRPGATARSGHGQQADEAEPDDDQDEPGDLVLRALREEAPDRGRAGPEQDEDDREPEDERDARAHHPRRGPRLAEPPRLDRGDRGQVARHERKDARRHDRDEPDRERDRELD